MTIDAAGAAGGGSAGGGQGAELAASFAVTPGETLDILVVMTYRIRPDRPIDAAPGVSSLAVAAG